MRFVNVFGEHLLAFERNDLDIMSELLKSRKCKTMSQEKFLNYFLDCAKRV